MFLDLLGGASQCAWLEDNSSGDAEPGSVAASLDRRVSRVDVSPVGSGRSAFLSLDVRRDVLVAAREDARTFVVQINELPSV